MIKNELKTISFYCKKCGKSLKMEYALTGDDKAPLLSNMIIRCNTRKCTRVMIPKNFTEGKLLENADSQGRYFL